MREDEMCPAAILPTARTSDRNAAAEHRYGEGLRSEGSLRNDERPLTATLSRRTGRGRKRTNHATNTGGGMYLLRTVPLGSALLLRLHGCASGPKFQSTA